MKILCESLTRTERHVRPASLQRQSGSQLAGSARLLAADRSHKLCTNGMKKIPLSQGFFAIVSDADYAYLSQWKWYAHRPYSKGSWYARKVAFGQFAPDVIPPDQLAAIRQCNAAALSPANSSLAVQRAGGRGRPENSSSWANLTLPALASKPAGPATPEQQ